MTISYEQQRQDVESATRATTLRALRPVMYCITGFGVLFLTAFVLTAFTHNREAQAALLQNGKPLLYLAIIFALLFWLSPKLGARKVLLRHTRWSFEDSAVTVDSEIASAQISWAAFQKYKETPHEFLLYVQKNQAHFIPKRVLSEAEQQELRDLLARHLKK